MEEYVQTMDKLTTDMRFTVFNICYKRILVIWIATAFTILLCLLFSGFQVNGGRNFFSVPAFTETTETVQYRVGQQNSTPERERN